MTWNRAHAGLAAAPAVAIDWSVMAMTESADRLADAQEWELPPLASAVAETVWWVTLVDATLFRYHPSAYEKALADAAVRRQRTERTLAGLRYVRNQLGRSVSASELICRADGARGAQAWIWQPMPEPELATLGQRARQWELSRYRAYQDRLAGRDIRKAFGRCTRFLMLAAGLAVDGAPDAYHA